MNRLRQWQQTIRNYYFWLQKQREYIAQDVLWEQERERWRQQGVFIGRHTIMVFDEMPAPNLKIGKNSGVDDYTILTSHRNRKLDQGDPGVISIGEGVWIGKYNNIRGGGGSITIGNDCGLSQFVTILGSSPDMARYTSGRIPRWTVGQDVVIEDGVRLGVGVTILPGVTIGTGCAVGVGAVVDRDLPPHASLAGPSAPGRSWRGGRRDGNGRRRRGRFRHRFAHELLRRRQIGGEGDADEQHLCRVDGLRRLAHLDDALEQQLPRARQRRDGEFLRHRRDALAL